MLGNLLDAVEAVSPALERVIAMQGGKAYGVHLGRVPVPAKERWPRGPHEIFYWAQEDLLARRSASAGWTYTLLRPQRILGDAVASPLSIVAALGVYAATWRERGRPLTFPGGGRYVNACTDSRLLARAIEHCAVTDGAANETFNVVNGDWVDWRDLWPRVAARFRMPVGPDEPLSLAEHMPAHEAAWRRLALRHGLRHRTMAEVAGPVWGYADLVLGAGDDHPHHNVMSPVKLLGTGFADGEDTEDSIDYWLGRLQTSRVLPP
jgi:nucleoside-diphosphate-sugar epimerase